MAKPGSFGWILKVPEGNRLSKIFAVNSKWRFFFLPLEYIFFFYKKRKKKKKNFIFRKPKGGWAIPPCQGHSHYFKKIIHVQTYSIRSQRFKRKTVLISFYVYHFTNTHVHYVCGVHVDQHISKHYSTTTHLYELFWFLSHIIYRICYFWS